MKRYLWAVEANYGGVWKLLDVFETRAEARKETKEWDARSVRIVKYVSESTASSAGTTREAK